MSKVRGLLDAIQEVSPSEYVLTLLLHNKRKVEVHFDPGQEDEDIHDYVGTDVTFEGKLSESTPGHFVLKDALWSPWDIGKVKPEVLTSLQKESWYRESGWRERLTALDQGLDDLDHGDPDVASFIKSLRGLDKFVTVQNPGCEAGRRSVQKALDALEKWQDRLKRRVRVK